jgi:hypothetical protein
LVSRVSMLAFMAVLSFQSDLYAVAIR